MQGTLQSTMIRASAGSGKTWQLSNRFLALMMLGVEPQKIIALTFTRKAAGEFTGRIMTRLAEGAASDENASKLAAELREVIVGKANVPALVEGDVSQLPVMDQSAFRKKLRELVESLDKLALSTLDSYFVRIVRHFALELGLSGFDLLEDAAISNERLGVMITIFSNSQTRKDERESFLNAFKQATWGEEENRLGKTLEAFVKEHQNRWLIAPEAEKWGGIDGIWPDGCPLPQGGNYAEKAAHVRALLGDIENVHGSYLNSWKKACDWAEQHTAGAPMSKAPTRIVDGLAYLEDFQKGYFHTVFSKREQVIKGDLAEAIYLLCGGMVRDEMELHMKRTRGLFSVIQAYEKHYDEHVRGRGRLCFSDLTLLLAGEGAMKIWDESARELIDYRLDARYDHWMLDEFQDTSQPQWQAIRHLVDEIMQDTDGTRSLFVVGDSKQSIYGWRGGEPRLFDDLQDYYGDRLKQWSMDASYRSSAKVLNLVNAVCDLTDDKWQAIFPEAAVNRWDYHEHVPAVEKAGHSLVIESQADAGDESEAKAAARYDAMVKILLQVNPIIQGMTCAILVTKNDQVSAVVDYLRTHLPDVPVAAESETTIADGPEGSVMLDLFRWLQCADHEFGRVHVELSPLKKVVEDITQTDQASVQWQLLTERIAGHGVEPLVNELVKGLRKNLPDLSAYGESRLDEILLAARKFTSLGGFLTDWIRLLESHKLRESTREGMVQVMTVHKSKGLGFDVVILPELDGSKSFTDSSKLSVLERKGRLGEVDYILKKPSQSVQQAVPPVAAMMQSWEADQCYERFCNLYVALTRAVHATYCIIDPVRDSWSCKARYADWLRESTSSWEDSEIEIMDTSFTALYQSGDWVLSDLAEDQDSPALSVPAMLPPAVPRVGRKVASSGKAYQAGTLLNKGRGMRFGNAVHALFEKVTWLDDLPSFSEEASARVVEECLQADSIKPYFERPQADHILLREQPIETRLDGEWISGVLDRAVVSFENGEATSIQVIDFKTDTGESADSLRDKYAPQLVIYQRALASIYRISEADIECYLLSTSLKEMVKL